MMSISSLVLVIASLMPCESSSILPAGDSPAPVKAPHFPDRVSAFIWRNWTLVPTQRIADVLGAQPAEVLAIGREMGLPAAQPISDRQWERSYITILRRNWHLLPYDQLLQLLDWTPEKLAFVLREDDFLFIKLGNRKPKCEPLVYQPLDDQARARLRQIAKVVREEIPDGIEQPASPLFQFLSELAAPLPAAQKQAAHDRQGEFRFSPRYCYSYFAMYGDPLLDLKEDPFPDGYLERLAASGVDGVWLHAVLYKLAPFPWEAKLSQDYERRLENLRLLIAKARKHGIGIYLYLNEPRTMPLAFFEKHPELKGLVEGHHAALCTSVPAVREYLIEAIGSVCKAAPDLAGFFTITGSENLTNCWAHHSGLGCARCGPRGQDGVLVELHRTLKEAIDRVGGKQRLILWDWGWLDDVAGKIIEQLPAGTEYMSVSEWGTPIERGGVKTAVGEYSISVVGPSERTRHRWQLAQGKGLRTLAKIQAGNTWELSAVPYIPAVANVAQHAANLRDTGVNGMMLGWTLGGYPSPNLDVVAEVGRKSDRPGHPTVDEAMAAVAERRFGEQVAPAMVRAWRQYSTAFSEFPYNGGTVYYAPLQSGPANPLWAEPTGHPASMVCYGFDDLVAWRSVYPPQVFIDQLEKVADGFEAGLTALERAVADHADATPQAAELRREMDVARATAIHFRSVANQSRFVVARDALAKASDATTAAPLLAELKRMLQSELDLARNLYLIQCRDSRIGFEASNHYHYVPGDLLEKIINCRDLLDRWLPAQSEKKLK